MPSGESFVCPCCIYKGTQERKTERKPSTNWEWDLSVNYNVRVFPLNQCKLYEDNSMRRKNAIPNEVPKCFKTVLATFSHMICAELSSWWDGMNLPASVFSFFFVFMYIYCVETFQNFRARMVENLKTKIWKQRIKWKHSCFSYFQICVW